MRHAVQLALLLAVAATAALAAPTAIRLPDGKPFDIGWASAGITARRRVLWVSPATGSDANSGATQAQAVQTFTRAWDMVRLQPGASKQGAGL